MDIFERIWWAFVDTLVLATCPACKRHFKHSESRYWPHLTTTWGARVKVCPDCYRKEYSWTR